MSNSFFPAVQYQYLPQPENALSDLAKAAAIKSSQQQTQQSQQAFPIEQQQRQAQAQLGQQAVQSGALDLAQRQAINDAWKQAMTPDPATGMITADPEKLQTALAASNHGEAIPAISKGLMDMQKTVGDLRAQKSSLAASEADAAGAGAQAVLASGKQNPDGSVTYDPNVKAAFFQHMQAAGYGQQVMQLQNHLQQAPQTETQLWQSLIAASPKQQQLAVDSAKSGAAQLTAETEKRKEDFIEAHGGTSPELQAQNAWLAKNPGKDASDYQIMMKKLVPAYNFNLQNNGGASPNAADPLVKAVADGSMKIGDVITYRTPLAMRKQFLQAVLQANPNFKASEYDIQTGVTKDFTTGKAAQNLTAFNTAIEHANQLGKAADALDNGDVRGLNAIGNQLGYQFGSDKMTNFNTVKNALAGEVSKVFRGSGATDAEMAEVQQPLSAANSPAQLKGAINQIVTLMNSKRDALKQQYEQGQKGQPNFGDNNAPKQAGGVPPGATHTAPGSDGKRHYTNAQGQDLGPVQ